MTALLPHMRPGDPGAALTPQRRTGDLDALAGGAVVDVLVVGGGITGVGVALDAASRGLSVALVEQADLAHGTSRWSSKLIHGGLRYLARGDLNLAAESAQERGILMTRTAPHLVHARPFLTPLGVGVGRLPGAVMAAGLVIGDGLRRLARTSGDVLPRPRRVSTAEAVELFPRVRQEGLRGGLLHWDGQLEDDARLVVTVARTAAVYGARILTRVRAIDIGPGGALVEDTLGDSRFVIRARTVVNATGVWASQLDPQIRLTPSRGTHLVLPAELLGHPRAALNVPVPGSAGRFVFAVPTSDDLVIVGLTDEAVDGRPPDVPEPTAEEMTFLLDTLSTGLARPLDRADVVGSYAGLRPLLAGVSSGRTADLSRRHAVVRHGDVVTVVGGKLTTYRRMAADTVDLLSDAPCVTDRLPLVGAGPIALAAGEGLPTRLVRRFGSEAGLVADLAAEDPSLLEPVAPGVPVLGVEVIWAVRQEGALTVDDVLDRRTRIGLVPTWQAAARPAVAALVEAGLGHGAAKRR